MRWRCADYGLCVSVSGEGRIAALDLDAGPGAFSYNYFCPTDQLPVDEMENPDRVGGTCVDQEACRWLSAEGGERCRYSDGSWFEEGPSPASDCLGDGSRLGQLCGGGCGGCEEYTYIPLVVGGPTGCLGIAEDRPHGYCVSLGLHGGYRCGRDDPEPLSEILETIGQQWHARGTGLAPPLEVVCVVQAWPDGSFPDYGYFLPQDVCLTYAERYPGSVECRSGDWVDLAAD